MGVEGGAALEGGPAGDLAVSFCRAASAQLPCSHHTPVPCTAAGVWLFPNADLVHHHLPQGVS